MFVTSNYIISEYIIFLAVGFVFKLLDLIHILVVQTSVDIFLIDWERPTVHEFLNQKNQKQKKESSVSIWRTYFVANEWNEIQTARKINPIFQMITSVFFLSVIGFGNLATEDPYENFQLNNPDQYYAPMSAMFRFAMIALVYLVVGKIFYIYI